MFSQENQIMNVNLSGAENILDDARLRIIFDEIKAKNTKTVRDFITFKNFEAAIKEYKIPLMKGLRQEDPEFHRYCKELFMMVCQSTLEQKESKLQNKKSPAAIKPKLINQRVEPVKRADDGKSKQPRQKSASQHKSVSRKG